MKELDTPEDAIQIAARQFGFKDVDALLATADMQHKPEKEKVQDFTSVQLYHAHRNAYPGTEERPLKPLREALPAHVFGFIETLKQSAQPASLPKHYRLALKPVVVIAGRPNG